MPATKEQIDRINELSGLARTAWFSLLGYLVFVGITLLGVKDADFFIPSRQTDLPLVNVAIPTASFFWTAPILGAALYAYLHLFLIKLWDAHGEARTSDADPTHHWLVNDFVLIRQRDPTALARPLVFLTDWITRLLVWAAGPIVLTYAWWRSMPAHNEWLTLLIAACLWLTLGVGFTSWWRAEASLSRDDPWLVRLVNDLALIRQRDHTALIRLYLFYTDWIIRLLVWATGAAVSAGLVALFLIAISWLRTESGPLLAQANLAGAELVPLPDDWRAPETARAAFRDTWCKREGLAMETCDQPEEPDRAIPLPVAAARTTWCAEHGGLVADACAAHFASLDARFAEAWFSERQSVRANLATLSLRERDLRNVFAVEAVLVGANLRRARLEGANLFRAELEGANLSQARLKGANLSQARLEGADLSGARLEGAGLWGARLEGADLRRARLEGANLSGARLEGADLSGARLEGADLSGAELEGADLSQARLEGADLSGARLEGANLRAARFAKSNWADASIRPSVAQFADLRSVQGLTQTQLDNLIGNVGTLLTFTPESVQPLYVWSCWETEPTGFDTLVAQVARDERSYIGPVAAGGGSRRSSILEDEERLRAEFLCSPDKPRQKTGTPLAVDAPYPQDHPLAQQN